MPNEKWVCKCGKSYKFDTGYYRHKKKCKFEEEDMVSKLNNDNLEYKKMFNKMIEENAKLITHIGELIPKVGNNNYINKQKINFNIFLNEQCKEAISMNEFINQIKINIDNLITIKSKGINEGISDIFIENMNKLSLYERPLHCTDPKREIIYIKNKTWEKDINNNQLKKALKKIEEVQEKSLNNWKKEFPNCLNNPEQQEDYLKLVKSSTDDILKNSDKVIKKICSNIHLKEENII